MPPSPPSESATGCVTTGTHTSTVKPVLRDHCIERPPVLRDQSSRDKELHFSLNTTCVRRPPAL